MQQRWALHSLNTTDIRSPVDPSHCYCTFGGRIGLIISKGEEIRLIRTRFDTVYTDMRLNLRDEVEHAYLIILSYKTRNKQDMNHSHAKRIARSNFDPHQYERSGVSSSEVEDIKDVFDMFDSQGTGFVRTADLLISLDSLGDEPQQHTLYKMLQDQQHNKTSHLDFQQFLELITSRVSTKDTRRDMKKIFNMFDEQKTGFISIQMLKAAVKQFGDNIDQSELREMIDKADLDKDNLVSEEEFYLIMTSKDNRIAE